MIARLAGNVGEVTDNIVLLWVGDVGYEVIVPAHTAGALREAADRVTLLTIQVFEGNPAVGNLTPRLYGFRNEADREFARLLTDIKGVSLRKALRAMGVPTADIAAAIQRGDARYLTELPEIGKKTAAEMIATLREKVAPFTAVDAGPAPAITAAPLTDAQRVAVDVLVQWGERLPDAQRWVAEALAAEPSLTAPEDIVTAAYRVKNRAK
jgi:Holliday junction DNA helicase RuvA